MIIQGMYIADRYEVIGKIGAGGMSDVYKAMDHTLGRYVAIKVLKSEFSEDLNFVAKFRTEASSAAGLEHPNIVNIYDVGSESDVHYIVMEYIEGITLKTYIEKKGQLTFKEAISIAIQVGRGIEAAHNKGIIHRDIKPQNIIISTEGKVKVTDFGIAKAATANTISSDVMGSVHYSSPEQARNGFVDGKSDIYSLGIVMYEMVTGRVPFDGDSTVAVAIQHLQEEMTPPGEYAPNIPVSMEKIILKCTQKSQDRRYENMTALLSDLRKSLISPDEDFVVIAPLSQDKTRIIGAEEVAKIKQKTGSIHVDEETLMESTKQKVVRNKSEEKEVYSEEEDIEEDDYEEEDINPVMDKVITIAGITAGIVIVILIIVILLNFLGGFSFSSNKNNNTQQSQSSQNTQQTQQTQTSQDTQQNQNTQQSQTEMQSQVEDGILLMDLRGSTFSEATEKLNAEGLGIRKAGVISSDEYEEGQIISQVPAAGESVLKNTTIEVVVSSGPAMIDIPNVKGEGKTEAKRILEEAGFTVSMDYDYSDTIEEGRVVSQTPVANSLGNKGDQVTIVISRGPEIILVKVPNVVNRTQGEAITALTNAGLKVGTITTSYNDTVAKDCVISQSIPNDTQVAKQTVVNLEISLGKNVIAVPNVVGKDEYTAVTTLEALGLKVAIVDEYNASVPKGYVVYQDVAENAEVDKNSTITIVISKGPEPASEQASAPETNTDVQTGTDEAGSTTNDVETNAGTNTDVQTGTDTVTP